MAAAGGLFVVLGVAACSAPAGAAAGSTGPDLTGTDLTTVIPTAAEMQDRLAGDWDLGGSDPRITKGDEARKAAQGMPSAPSTDPAATPESIPACRALYLQGVKGDGRADASLQQAGRVYAQRNGQSVTWDIYAYSDGAVPKRIVDAVKKGGTDCAQSEHWSGTTVFTPKDPDAAGWTQAQNQKSCIAQAVGNALVQSCADTPADAETVQKAFVDKINSSTGKH